MRQQKVILPRGRIHVAATILEELVTILKGTGNGEESLYMLAMTYYNQGDYVSASHYFNTYYTTYPRGTYTELARFYSGKAMYLDTPGTAFGSKAVRIRRLTNFKCLWILPGKFQKEHCPRYDFRVAR